MNATSISRLMTQLGKIERKELEIKMPRALAIALGVTVLIYILLLPVRNSAVGQLIYARGFTQYLVILLTSIVGVVVINKYIKINQELKAFRKFSLYANLDWYNPMSPQLYNYQQSLAKHKSLIAVRCSWILAVYINAGNRQTAIDFAEEDSAFYNNASESSYTIARILIWAIPLLGFIGTVVGISQGVSGFSEFLEQAGDIEQIKEGIGVVTSGLAVAFDTTFLALLLSVLIMIPLVLVEQLESGLLLEIDMFINDQLFPFLKAPENLDKKELKIAVNQAFQEYLPDAKALIEPAQEYAQQAASLLAQGFVAEIEKIQKIHGQLIEEMVQGNKMTMEDRQTFVKSIQRQQQTSQEIVAEIAKTVAEIKENNTVASQGIGEQAERFTQELFKATQSLETRINALTDCANQVAEIVKLQQSLDLSLQKLEQTAKLEEVLVELKESIVLLQPGLQQLSQPRRITLVEENNSKEIENYEKA
ncbi:MAG: MotA/TolQ/ExbB proton channel family protein [Gomphosphaeria aponina SAG 52.96 = DSM 107014]|uniref:MotA/TolQ/ExbB proton channel family protein n=1 Tax=Gomphosphaeria aponina SAG 52.96 = DSM 107014 TaxID=1521640 RepID=A0A941JUV2_9CHRO|nr:MotA/TolQ/ExbB proton channel family protein [Gomphosphaeria aponina SAG 52.96 = DSM 107014]